MARRVKRKITPATILMAQIRRAKQKVLDDKDFVSALALQKLQQRYRRAIKLRIVDDDYEEENWQEKVSA